MGKKLHLNEDILFLYSPNLSHSALARKQSRKLQCMGIWRGYIWSFRAAESAASMFHRLELPRVSLITQRHYFDFRPGMGVGLGDIKVCDFCNLTFSLAVQETRGSRNYVHTSNICGSFLQPPMEGPGGHSSWSFMCAWAWPGSPHRCDTGAEQRSSYYGVQHQRQQILQ